MWLLSTPNKLKTDYRKFIPLLFGRVFVGGWEGGGGGVGGKAVHKMLQIKKKKKMLKITQKITQKFIKNCSKILMILFIFTTRSC